MTLLISLIIDSKAAIADAMRESIIVISFLFSFIHTVTLFTVALNDSIFDLALSIKSDNRFCIPPLAAKPDKKFNALGNTLIIILHINIIVPKIFNTFPIASNILSLIFLSFSSKACNCLILFGMAVQIIIYENKMEFLCHYFLALSYTGLQKARHLLKFKI